MSNRKDWPPVIGEQFTQAWINLAELPGVMMQSGQVPLQHFQLSTEGDGLLASAQVEDKFTDEGSKLGVGEVSIGVPQDNVQDGKAEFDIHPPMVTRVCEYNLGACACSGCTGRVSGAADAARATGRR